MTPELTIAERKAALMERLAAISLTDIEDASNFKLMNLIRSRLIEEGIPMELARRIVSMLTIDVTCLNEDDDFLGDIADTFASVVMPIYNKLASTNWHRDMPDAMIQKYFANTKISLD